MRIIAHPFTINPNGAVATVDQDGDAAPGQLLAVLILTRPGERALVPGYGTPDPVFNQIDMGSVTAGAAAFGPDITITDVTTTILDDGRQKVRIEYEP